MGPVVTLMMGRIEDWLHVLTERDGIVADPVAVAVGRCRDRQASVRAVP